MLIYVLLMVIRVCSSIILNIFSGVGDRAIFNRLIAVGPAIIFYIYYRDDAEIPLINFNGSTGYLSIFLTFWTYALCKVGLV